MYLTKLGYFLDFIVYPFFLLLLATPLFWAGTSQHGLAWGISCFMGMVGFSLLEYLLHRFVLHGISPFNALHGRHHAQPNLMIGTPTWMTASGVSICVLLPLWWSVGMSIACGATFGIILSYLWYGLLHHAIHHWPTRRNSYLIRLKHHHGLHHRDKPIGNFGVTTAFWDYVFGTLQSR